ncbi:lytic polysaccharide monooxygenase auxiliary activity family 9 protein [Burkholderia thailandensis]|uniref:lytic polysaccharide monooxygenase auxiliary activity family 9 protein n=1 Tax=Burkholderia thailandensis TaxID=57975 RepID=UPI003F8F86A9
MLQTLIPVSRGGTREIDNQMGIQVGRIWYWADEFAARRNRKKVEVRVDMWNVCVAYARAQLNEPDSVAHWQKHSVRSGQSLQISWSYSMPHKTRRWTYWITKPGWDASARLARAHFEPEPLKVYLNTYQPYWGPDADKELIPRGDTIHEFNLPTRTGYHVLLAVWDIADTANAFYQVIDLNFA